MGRIRALLATGFDPTTFPIPVQHQIEEATFGSMSQQTTAKFGEHGEVKPGMAQFQA
jgi:hypothetical protein